MKVYQFHIENKTDEVKKAILLGLTINLLKSNYGSDEGILVSATEDDTKYLDLLMQTGGELFCAKRIMIFSDKYLPESIKIGNSGNNRNIELNIDTGTFKVRLAPPINVDENILIEIRVKPKSNLIVTLFCSKIDTLHLTPYLPN
jgi:hypothetical protein